MKAILQRVLLASVTVDGHEISSINNGYMVLLGIEQGDNEDDVNILAEKTAGLRVFDDENGNLNLSIIDISGEVLVVSNFTLCANSKKGRRPSFSNAAKPQEAKVLYQKYCDCLIKNGVRKVEKGKFGADMKVELINDGPVTIILDTKELR